MEIGTRVIYFGNFGNGDGQPGTITGKGEKNGREVYDVTLEDGDTRWGYADQFEVR
jgi:hypothetical protein